MVRSDGELVLVDYDNMCVPTLVGQASFEWGLPAYQHPDRATQPLSLAQDEFSAWIILIALRAVSAQPNLWERYVDGPQNENILFTQSDMANPTRSSLWAELAASPDSDVRQWASRLHVSLDQGFDRIPPFAPTRPRPPAAGPVQVRSSGNFVPRQVFISHSTRDCDFVEREIVPLLNRHGIETWYERQNIRPASRWDDAILDGLEVCDWFLVVMSPRSQQSEHVRDEVSWAIDNRQDRIVPVLLEDCVLRKIHMRMARIQFVDFRNDLRQARTQLLATWGIPLSAD